MSADVVPLLEGIRVLDMTTVLSGPFCTYQLSLLGADVVKVEQPGGGDPARRLGADPELNAVDMGASFVAQNSGKRSIQIDLKQESGRRSFERLVATADVLVENFRAGVLARLGFDWPRLRRLNPRLVYCSISGFGHGGPYHGRAAYDQIIQGMSGMMHATGPSPSEPARVGFPVSDTIAGLTAAMGIAAALASRARTGRGGHVDVSMLEASLAAMGWLVSNQLIAGQPPIPMGNDNFTAAPSGTFATADGYINISANQQAQFERLCRALGVPELIDDAAFSGPEARKRNRLRLNEHLNAVLAQRTSRQWEDVLVGADVPVGPVLSVDQSVELEQLVWRRFVHEVREPTGRRAPFRVVGNGLHVDGAPLEPQGPPPLLGEHTDEVLAEAGLAPHGEAELLDGQAAER